MHSNKFSEVNEEHPETSGGLASALHQLKFNEINEEHPETSGGLVSALQPDKSSTAICAGIGGKLVIPEVFMANVVIAGVFKQFLIISATCWYCAACGPLLFFFAQRSKAVLG